MKTSVSHVKWRCKYHIIWIPKYRRKILYGEFKREVGQIIRRLCEYKGVEIIEGSLGKDHIHVCLSIPPKYSISSVVGYIKGKSALILFDRHSNLRKRFHDNKLWARGYYVSTVGLNEQEVRRYIREQSEREEVISKYEMN